jgi:hypothetical protein
MIAMERDKMLVGDPTAAMVRFGGFDAYGLQAIHLTGPNEAPGGSCPTFVHCDFAASNYPFWDMCLDWTTPANSTLSAPNTVDSAPFFPFFDSVPTPAGGANYLDSFGSNTMYRATARAFSKDAPNRIALVINHVVQGNSQQAGIKWLQFNLKPAIEPVGVTDRIFGDGYEGSPLPVVVAKTVLTKTLVDEGTYAPDSNHRWMGGIAIDGSGNIGLGFSKSSAALNPQVQYTARRATDAPGLMRDEQTCTAGIANGAQTDSAGRWGDYSSMSVDPVDQCTFYFTSEYYATSSARNFSTRVCSFTFPDCGTPDYQLVNETPKRIELCGTGAIDPTWGLRAGVLNGFTGPVTLSGVGTPPATTAMFSVNPINAPGTSTLTLSGGAALVSGEYAFSVSGVSGALNRSIALELGVSSSTSSAPTVRPGQQRHPVSADPGWARTWRTQVQGGNSHRCRLQQHRRQHHGHHDQLQGQRDPRRIDPVLLARHPAELLRQRRGIEHVCLHHRPDRPVPGRHHAFDGLQQRLPDHSRRRLDHRRQRWHRWLDPADGSGRHWSEHHGLWHSQQCHDQRPRPDLAQRCHSCGRPGSVPDLRHLPQLRD